MFQLKSENDSFKYSEYPFVKETLEMVYDKYPKIYHCLALILDIELDSKNKEKSYKIIDNLVEIDHIRKKYWLWIKQNLKDN